jgi:hypothetical protein
MSQIVSARARVVDAMRRMEAGHLSAAPQAQLTQLGSLFVQAARLYATQISVAVHPGHGAQEWELPADCQDPAACARQGSCLYTPCSYRNSTE